MRILHHFADPGQPAQALVILLPGALQQPEQFLQFGFADAVRARGLPLDLAMPDLAVRYLTETIDGSVCRRIHDGVVQPARRDGYRTIWLAGISIGALIAASHAERYPGAIDGLCLLAPYPGSRLLTNRIGTAGGVAGWDAGEAAASHSSDDSEYRLWRWLKTYRRQPGAPEIFLGYGRQDRFAAGQRMMAQALDPGCVAPVEGGHDWPTWQRLWDVFLNRCAAGFGSASPQGPK